MKDTETDQVFFHHPFACLIHDQESPASIDAEGSWLSVAPFSVPFPRSRHAPALRLPSSPPPAKLTLAMTTARLFSPENGDHARAIAAGASVVLSAKGLVPTRREGATLAAAADLCQPGIATVWETCTHGPRLAPQQ